jgi:hypothetical protein
VSSRSERRHGPLSRGLLGLALLFAGCGAKSGLDDGRGEGAPDAGPSALWIDCAAMPGVVAVGDAVAVRATVEGSDASLVEWTVRSGPDGASLAPAVGASSTFVATREGLYEIMATVRSGLTVAQCTTVVDVVASLGLGCGEEIIRGLPGQLLSLAVGVVGEPTDITWRVLERPDGSEVELRTDGALAVFSGDRAGSYRLRVIASAAGDEAACELRVELGPPPDIDCPPARLVTSTGQELILAFPSLPAGASVQWMVLERPPMSVAELAQLATSPTSLVPDQVGTYRVRGEAHVDERVARCDIVVLALPSPTALSCPDVVDARPLEPTVVNVSVRSDADPLTYHWTLVEQPRGSRAELADATSASARFTPDLVGDYRLAVRVTDAEGVSVECVVRVRVVGQEGLRVEMFWDTDDSDMDLHLLHPDATRWYTELDCYFRNCAGEETLEWGAPGTVDDPRLALDERFGFGPENTNVLVPEAGTYRVGVTAFDDCGRVWVRIYCGGPEPVGEFGPVELDALTGEFWRVADVTVADDGSCRVTSLSRGGEPDIVTSNTARRER